MGDYTETKYKTRNLRSPDEEFRFRALWVWSIGFALYLIFGIGLRVTLEGMDQGGWIRILATSCVLSGTIACLWFRFHSRTVSRIALYLVSVSIIVFISRNGGLSAPQAPALLVMPAICALLFSSRETFLFGTYSLCSLFLLFFIDPHLSVFEAGEANRVYVSLIGFVGLSLFLLAALFVLIRDAEKNQETLRHLLAEQEHAATHDELTDLANRTGVKRYLTTLNEKNTQVAVFLIDLDGFKHINDSFGHDSGDEVLVRVARTLDQVSDPNVMVARLGGDEFLIAVEFKSDELDIREKTRWLGDTLVEALNLKFSFLGEQANISASVGSALFPSDATDTSTLLKLADKALYNAKKAGKSRYTEYSDGDKAGEFADVA